MRRRGVPAFTLILTIFLLTVLSSGLKVEKVKANGAIFIRADGSIDPPTISIQITDNYTIYTFTDNIYDEIIVERDNIVVNGAGYLLHGLGNGTGIDLNHRYNVTIQNVEVTNFHDGIYLNSSNNNGPTSSSPAAPTPSA